MLANFEKYPWSCSIFSKDVDCEILSSLKMISSAGIFWTFIITSVGHLLAKDLFFGTLLGGGFIIVVAHINSRNLIEDIRSMHLWRPHRKGVGEVLKFVACLQILLFQNRDLLFIFADSGNEESAQKINHFCGCHKWLTPLFVWYK